ncbi:MAG TPA: AMP-binding protein [Rhizomicrobium sp.]|nr:AMP-binding protein [Rhizomicrobium sp.]
MRSSIRSPVPPMPRDVVDLFLARAVEAPDHPAIVTSTASITYGGLERRVRAFAAALAKRSAPKVLIALPASIDAYACMFAAGLAGGFYTPLNMASPAEKMRRICAQLEPDIVVGHPDMLERLSGAAPGAVSLDPAGLDEEGLLDGAGSRHALAYVLFTSGSTGEPKGVMIPRAALADYAAWLGALGIGRTDHVSQQPNIAFDLSVVDIFGTLCYGATLYPLDVEGDRLMPARFIRRNAITVWNSTPSAVSVMIRARQAKAENLASVRLFNFCGEPLLKEHLDALFAAVPDAIVQNTYGPTEATVSMTALRLDARNYAEHCANSVALGSAIPGMELLLNGSSDEGEIVIVGPQLAQGYWNDPEKTASAFRAVSGTDPRRGYFTGDWAVRRGGDIYFRERIDFQVKVRGHRIELDEVAAAIRALGYPVVCVFKRGDALAAVVEHDGAFDETALRTALQAKLEPHAIPERIVSAAHLPRNENDKLDRGRAAALMEDRIARRHDT